MEYYGIAYFPLPEDEVLTDLPLSEDVIQKIENKAAFAQNNAGEQLTLQELYLEILPEFKSYLLQAIDKGNGFNSQQLITGRAECDALFAPDDLLVETVRGPRYIQFILFGTGYEIENELMTPLSALKYTVERRSHIASFSTSINADKTIRVNIKFD